MIITQHLVRKISQLSQLELSDSEERWYATEMSKILDYVNLLEGFKGNGTEFHGLGMSCQLRDDYEEKSEVIEMVINKAPITENSMFIVPKVLGTE